MVGAMARRAVAVTPAVVPGKEPIERVHRVIVRAGAELHDHEPGGGVRHEHRQQPVATVGVLGDEPPAGGRQVGEPALTARPDLELDGVYGKMLRSASRMRPKPPIAGADS
jgi:hypothetical protein